MLLQLFKMILFSMILHGLGDTVLFFVFFSFDRCSCCGEQFCTEGFSLPADLVEERCSKIAEVPLSVGRNVPLIGRLDDKVQTGLSLWEDMSCLWAQSPCLLLAFCSTTPLPKQGCMHLVQLSSKTVKWVFNLVSS